MENIRKITIEINPNIGEKDENGGQSFDLNISTETSNGERPKKKEVYWLMEEAIKTIKNYFS